MMEFVRSACLLICLCLLGCLACTATPKIATVYLIPGMGTDHRVFHRLNLDPALEYRILKWAPYTSCTTLAEYAEVLADQIDTTEQFALVGVSMGGMLAMEMANYVSPSQIILISSAKSPAEIPFRYKVGRYLPIYRLLSDRLLTWTAQSGRLFTDIQHPEDVVLYQQMLVACGAGFLKWQMAAICGWKPSTTSFTGPIYHVHGGRDKILPVRKVSANCILKQGTHKMIVNQATEIAGLINDQMMTTIVSPPTNH